MQLTTYTDYALRVLIYLAREPEQKKTIDDLTAYFQVSRNHLVKVVYNLAKKGFIRSVRGKNGGLYLSKSPKDINIGNVVRQMEGHFHIVECFNPTKQHLCVYHPQCQLISLLGNASEQFLQVLDQKTLSDVM